MAFSNLRAGILHVNMQKSALISRVVAGFTQLNVLPTKIEQRSVGGREAYVGGRGGRAPNGISITPHS